MADGQLAPRTPSVAVNHVSGFAMGMNWSVKWAGEPARGLVEKETRGVLSEIETQMSTYRPDSELSRFNALSGTDWMPVSSNLAHVVSLSLEVARQSDGALDPTVFPLVQVWGFGPDRRVGQLPTVTQIAAAKARVGHTNLQARLDPPALRKLRPDVAIDVSAVAMGYAADLVGKRLSNAGCVNYLVDMAGEFVARGPGAGGKGWSVGIKQPDAESKPPRRIIQLFEEGLATSGDDRNFREINGRRYHHIIDPRTGWPAEHNSASATVIRFSCAEADAWATAMVVLGPEQGALIAEKYKLKLIMIERRGNEYQEVLRNLPE